MPGIILDIVSSSTIVKSELQNLCESQKESTSITTFWSKDFINEKLRFEIC